MKRPNNSIDPHFRAENTHFTGFFDNPYVTPIDKLKRFGNLLNRRHHDMILLFFYSSDFTSNVMQREKDLLFYLDSFLTTALHPKNDELIEAVNAFHNEYKHEIMSALHAADTQDLQLAHPRRYLAFLDKLYEAIPNQQKHAQVLNQYLHIQKTHRAQYVIFQHAIFLLNIGKLGDSFSVLYNEPSSGTIAQPLRINAETFRMIFCEALDPRLNTDIQHVNNLFNLCLKLLPLLDLQEITSAVKKQATARSIPSMLAHLLKKVQHGSWNGAELNPLINLLAVGDALDHGYEAVVLQLLLSPAIFQLNTQQLLILTTYKTKLIDRYTLSIDPDFRPADFLKIALTRQTLLHDFFRIDRDPSRLSLATTQSLVLSDDTCSMTWLLEKAKCDFPNVLLNIIENTPSHLRAFQFHWWRTKEIKMLIIAEIDRASSVKQMDLLDQAEDPTTSVRYFFSINRDAKLVRDPIDHALHIPPKSLQATASLEILRKMKSRAIAAPKSETQEEPIDSIEMQPTIHLQHPRRMICAYRSELLSRAQFVELHHEFLSARHEAITEAAVYDAFEINHMLLNLITQQKEAFLKALLDVEAHTPPFIMDDKLFDYLDDAHLFFSGLLEAIKKFSAETFKKIITHSMFATGFIRANCFNLVLEEIERRRPTEEVDSLLEQSFEYAQYEELSKSSTEEILSFIWENEDQSDWQLYLLKAAIPRISTYILDKRSEDYSESCQPIPGTALRRLLCIQTDYVCAYKEKLDLNAHTNTTLISAMQRAPFQANANSCFYTIPRNRSPTLYEHQFILNGNEFPI